MTVTTLRLDPVKSPLLEGVSHGFFTRAGGASTGVFEGLNCGAGSSDQREVVAINRAKVAETMSVPPAHLLTVYQTHSADAVTVSGPPRSVTRADALVTATPDLAIAVLTADCQPVLLADRQAGVIAAAHAGWRGALDGILEATLDAMVGLGAVPERIKAAIGPSISQRAYEVGQEFLERFADDDPGNLRFFANGAQPDKYLFDLPAFGLERLRARGVQAEWTGHCTYSDEARFYSYRRSVHRAEADYGRLISAIRL